MIKVVKEAVNVKNHVNNENLTETLNEILTRFKIPEESVLGIQSNIEGIKSPYNQANSYIVTFFITYRE